MSRYAHARAVILAGGEGKRLRSLTRLICGDNRPKQFCPIFGSETLLGHTRQRVARAVSPERTLFAVLKAHEDLYSDELKDVSRGQIVVQPDNKGTAAAITYSLLRILQTDGDALAAFFPADHYYADESPFITAVDSALGIAQDHADSLVLLGAEPQSPEVEYGWIEPGDSVECSNGAELSSVNRFWEKPALQAARELLRRGCLWNTFVMVGRAKTFLEILKSTVPNLLRAFDPIADLCENESEAQAVRRLYKTLVPVDFSQQVLPASTDRLIVLRLRDAGWSDLGKPERVFATLARAGIEPQWATALQ